jgi:UPF0755 protein
MTAPFDDLSATKGLSPRGGPSDRSGEAEGGVGDPVDGDTPPHGVAPVVVPRTLARADAPPRSRRPPDAHRRRSRGSRAEEDGDGEPGPRGTGARPVRVAARHRVRRRRRRLTRRARVILVALGVAVLVVAGVGGWYESEASPSGKPGPAVVVDVHRGESGSAVMASLTKDGVIDSALAFRLWSFVHGLPTVRPGLYQLHRNLPFATVSADLQAGPNVYALDVIPGTTVAEIANELSQLPGNLAQAFEDDARTGVVRSPYQQTAGAPLEGLIGAGDYRITPHESARTLLSRMVARFDAEAAAAGLAPGATVGGESAYGVITVASIAMKEGYFARYYGKVARVVYNRLAADMPLDMTSTVLYSLGQDGGPVTPAEEQETTPYNTYLHRGLTPTPICTPTEAALRAAVAPPVGPWLYFELTTAKKGVMVFSASYTTQIAAEQQARHNAPGSGSGSSGSGSSAGT